MRILLIGHGRMGRLVEALAGEYGGEVVGIVDPQSPRHARPIDDATWRGAVDVAIDFSWAEAVPTNVPAIARQGVDVVIGTTGWQAYEDELRQAIAQAGTGLVAAPNFAAGVIVFEAIVREAARRFSSQAEFGAYVHEAHHVMKKDAPSGTALMLRQAMEGAGFSRPIDMSSTRAGHIPGVHTVGFEGPSDSITLTHAARDRSGFARGALAAARWVQGRRGWFTMHDVLGLRSLEAAP